MPAAGWAPRPLCGKCFHWKTSPPTECLQTQLLSSKAASTTDWDPFLMQIHIILLGNSRCSAMLSFRKIRTLLAPPPCTWLSVRWLSPSAHTWVPPGLGSTNQHWEEWDRECYQAVNITLIKQQMPTEERSESSHHGKHTSSFQWHTQCDTMWA